MLANEILERTASEYLHGGGVNLPAWTTLTTGITAAQTSMEIGTRSTPGGGDIVEFDDDSMELARTDVVSGTTVTFQERGYLETEAAAHNAGTRVIFNNPYPKHLLFQNLQGLIRQLYGFSLYQRLTDTSKTYNAITPIDLPAGAKDTQATILQARGPGLGYIHLKKGSHFEVLHAFTPPKVQFFHGGRQGFALTIPYKAEYGVPAALTDDLTTLGIPESLQTELPAAIASRVLAGKELPEATSEHIRRQLANSGQPVGTRISVSNALWNLFMRAVQLERVRLMEQAPPTIVFQ